MLTTLRFSFRADYPAKRAGSGRYYYPALAGWSAARFHGVDPHPPMALPNPPALSDEQLQNRINRQRVFIRWRKSGSIPCVVPPAGYGVPV